MRLNGSERGREWRGCTQGNINIFIQGIQGRIHKEVKDMVIKSVTNFPFCCITNNPQLQRLRPSTVIMAALSTGQVGSSPGLG